MKTVICHKTPTIDRIMGVEWCECMFPKGRLQVSVTRLDKDGNILKHLWSAQKCAECLKLIQIDES